MPALLLNDMFLLLSTTQPGTKGVQTYSLGIVTYRGAEQLAVFQIASLLARSAEEDMIGNEDIIWRRAPPVVSVHPILLDTLTLDITTLLDKVVHSKKESLGSHTILYLSGRMSESLAAWLAR